MLRDKDKEKTSERVVCSDSKPCIHECEQTTSLIWRTHRATRRADLQRPLDIDEP
jgi:hypothetical protein